ncbi:MAG: hypothetical protein KUG81_08995 [Gammaproteobacteria bacterium]|nr:hypothetical protein [Gammaproteobacteria bacterium]
MSKKLDLIFEERVYPVMWNGSTSINTNNGILNEEFVIKARRRFLGETVMVWSEELVDTKQHYPHNDISVVDFETDVVILKQKDFKLIQEFYEQFQSSRKKTITSK